MPAYVIIGDGAAGIAAAQAIRAEDAEATVTVLSDDPSPYYYRAALTNYLLGQLRDEQLWGVPPNFYRRHRIGRFFGRVLAVDTNANAISLDNGLSVPYDALLIASGASPVLLPVPGAELGGVYTFRTLQDVRAIAEQLPDVRAAVVVGGGALGLEWVQALRHRGIDVTYVLREPRMLPRVLDEIASELVLHELRTAGVRLLLEDEIAAIEPRSAGGAVQQRQQAAVGGVVTRTGKRIACDLVGVAIGVRPNTAFLGSSPIAIDRGVVVDSAMRSSVANVFAAGDVAHLRDPLSGEDAPPVGLWQPARAQGQIAGANMVRAAAGAASKRYRPGAMFQATHLYTLDFAAVGQSTVEAGDQGLELLIDRPAPCAYRKVVLRGKTIAGGLFIGDRRGALACKRIMDSGLDITPIRDRLLDAHFDLAGWLRQGDLRSGVFTAARPVFDVRPEAPRPTGQRPLAAQAPLEPPSEPIAPPDVAIPQIRPPAELRFAGVAYRLREDAATLLGRDAACDVVVDSGHVSRRHAEVRPTPGGYAVHDLGSANGTWVGLTRVQPETPRVLHDGDSIRLADADLTFALRPEPTERVGALSAGPAALRLRGPDGAFALSADVISMGRGADVMVSVPSRLASRLHAQIQRGGDGDYFLYDLGSSNGTFVNGARITDAHQLAAGDVIAIAGVEYTVEAGRDAAPTAASGPAELVVAAGTGAGERHVLAEGETRIGRAERPENEIVLHDPLVSRRHALIALSDGAATISDLGSSGGTLLNGAFVNSRQSLHSGDTIVLGQTRLVFSAAKAPAAAVPFVAEQPTILFTAGQAAPSAAIAPALVVASGPSAGTRHPLTPGRMVVIGRRAAAGQADAPAIALDDGRASRRHAAVSVAFDGSATVEDLGSSNGTLLNGERLTQAVALQEGDALQIGETVLRFTGAARNGGAGS